MGLCIVVKSVVWRVMLSVAADPPRCWYQPRKPPQSIPPAHRHSTHTSCWGGRWSGRSRTWCGSPGRSWSGSRGSPSACARSRGPGTPGTGSTGAVEGWLVDGSVYVDRRLSITHTRDKHLHLSKSQRTWAMSENLWNFLRCSSSTVPSTSAALFFFFWVLWVDCVVYRQSSDELDSTHIPTHPSIYITKYVRVGVGAAVLAQHGAGDAHAARGDGRLHVACCVGR